MTFDSSNSEWIEAMTDKKLVSNVREALNMGCVTPCHVYDQIDELLQRFCKCKGITEMEVK